MNTREMWFVRLSDDGEQKEMLLETIDQPRVWRYGIPLGPRTQLCASGICAIGETLRECYQSIAKFKEGADQKFWGTA